MRRTSTATASRISSSPTSIRRCSRSTSNDGNEFFSDVAAFHGVAQATRLLSGWGLKFFDYDNDGLVDLFLANGHPDDMIESYSQQVRYKEPLVLFHHDGTKLLERERARPARCSRKLFPARGLAVGDYNNDGRLDVLIGNNGEAPVLLKNNAGAGNHWLGLKLQGTTCNRDAIGATITWSLRRRHAQPLQDQRRAAISRRTTCARCSASARAAKIDWLEIKWPQPSGRVERFTDAADRSLRHHRRRQRARSSRCYCAAAPAV